MIYLVTGVPGAGKTSTTLFDLKERLVYHNGIDDVSDQLGWIAISDDQVLNWYSQDFVPGSAIVIDEAYRLFPQRTKGAVPEFIEKLAVHRHKGVDIYFIAQSPMMVDVFIRRLVGKHIHYSRNFGSKKITKYERETVMNNPDRRLDRVGALSSVQSLKKEVFGLYKSTVKDTHKLNIPKKVIIIGLLIFLMSIFSLYLLYGVFTNFSGNDFSNSSSSGNTSSPLEHSSFASSLPATPSKQTTILDIKPSGFLRVVGFLQWYNGNVCYVSASDDCKYIDMTSDCIIKDHGLFKTATANYKGNFVSLYVPCPTLEKDSDENKDKNKEKHEGLGKANPFASANL